MLGAALRGRTPAERERLAERAIALLWQGLQAPARSDSA
jgi:putative hemolysin